MTERRQQSFHTFLKSILNQFGIRANLIRVQLFSIKSLFLDFYTVLPTKDETEL